MAPKHFPQNKCPTHWPYCLPDCLISLFYFIFLNKSHLCQFPALTQHFPSLDLSQMWLLASLIPVHTPSDTMVSVMWDHSGFLSLGKSCMHFWTELSLLQLEIWSQTWAPTGSFLQQSLKFAFSWIGTSITYSVNNFVQRLMIAF